MSCVFPEILEFKSYLPNQRVPSDIQRASKFQADAVRVVLYFVHDGTITIPKKMRNIFTANLGLELFSLYARESALSPSLCGLWYT